MPSAANVFERVHMCTWAVCVVWLNSECIIAVWRTRADIEANNWLRVFAPSIYKFSNNETPIIRKNTVSCQYRHLATKSRSSAAVCCSGRECVRWPMRAFCVHSGFLGIRDIRDQTVYIQTLTKVIDLLNMLFVFFSNTMLRSLVHDRNARQDTRIKRGQQSLLRR